jgi:hypothetical protein
MGTAQTLTCLGPRLKPRHVNPHATLLTLHLNAVEEFAIERENKEADQSVAVNRILPYIHNSTKRVDVTSPYALSYYSKDIVLLAASSAIGRDVDLHFNRYVYKHAPPRFSSALPSLQIQMRFPIVRLIGIILGYMRGVGFADMPLNVGLMAKEQHSIIEKWPLRLKLSLPQPGAQEEFDVLQASGHNGSERYVEWSVFEYGGLMVRVIPGIATSVDSMCVGFFSSFSFNLRFGRFALGFD